jgi:outer membrane protein assembly factor BamA
MKEMKISLLVLLTFTLFNVANAQEEEEVFQNAPILNEARVTIRNVIVHGNKITKRYMVAREIVLKSNQTYTVGEVLEGLEKSRQNLLNTSLFVSAKTYFTNWQNDSMDVHAEIDERWYYFPVPYFKPMDRNFQVWARDYGLSLKRVNVGIKFMGENTTGRNDKLNIWLMDGFSRRIALKYYNPFSDPKLRIGWAIDVNQTWNKEIFYKSSNNKQLFYRDPNQFLRRDFYLGTTFSYRKGSINRHYLRTGWRTSSIADTVLIMNKNYLGDGLKSVAYPEIQYTFQHLKINYFPYPTKGSLFIADLLKRGVNEKMNLTQFTFRYGKFHEFKKKNYFSVIADAYLKAPFNQPYINKYLLGYGDQYLRGLERYVVDGVAGGMVKGTLGREIFNVKLNSGFNSKTYRTIPFKFYAKVHADVGYIYNNINVIENSLNNKLLYSFGGGLDIVSIYDFVLRIELTYNQFNKMGVYFHNYESRY